MTQLKSGLIIPSSVTSVDPPKYVCLLCRARFKKSQAAAYEAHVIRCSNRHEAEIHALSPRTKAPGIFGDEGWDKEEEAHFKAGGT